MKTNDLPALKLAMEIARRRPEMREQIDAKLRTETWRDVAEFAAYNCQFESLMLKPWQEPPCWADPNGHDTAALLRQRMEEVGISPFEPDPIAALNGR